MATSDPNRTPKVNKAFAGTRPSVGCTRPFITAGKKTTEVLSSTAAFSASASVGSSPRPLSTAFPQPSLRSPPSPSWASPPLVQKAASKPDVRLRGELAQQMTTLATAKKQLPAMTQQARSLSDDLADMVLVKCCLFHKRNLIFDLCQVIPDRMSDALTQMKQQLAINLPVLVFQWPDRVERRTLKDAVICFYVLNVLRVRNCFRFVDGCRRCGRAVTSLIYQNPRTGLSRKVQHEARRRDQKPKTRPESRKVCYCLMIVGV